MRGWGWLVLVVAGGCTSVRYVERGDCWLRETTRFYGAVNEELGPCGRAPPVWVADRPTRLVQECVAEADWRWRNDAVAAWTKGERLTAPSEAGLVERCQLEAAHTMAAENDSLALRLKESTAAHDRLREHNEHLADVLGEAAQKPAGTATATATARGDGTSKAENDSQLASDQRPGAPIVVPAPMSVERVVVPIRAKASQAVKRKVSAPPTIAECAKPEDACVCPPAP